MLRVLFLVTLSAFLLADPAAAQHERGSAHLPSWAAPGERNAYGSNYERPRNAPGGERSERRRSRDRVQSGRVASGAEYRSSHTGAACPPSSWNPGGEPPCGRVPDRDAQGDPEQVPVDGGLSLLFAAGAGYAAYRLREDDEEGEGLDEPTG